MIRLVTKDDLLRHPEFAGRGISLNMHHDFGDEEIIDIPNVDQSQSVPIETLKVETLKEEVVIPKPEPKVKKEIKKAAPKKVATSKKKK